jgi:hypothetical protein
MNNNNAQNTLPVPDLRDVWCGDVYAVFFAPWPKKTR